MTQWTEGTLFDNIDKFASALGYDNAGVILPLASISWDSPSDRDAFINMITNKPAVQGPQTDYMSHADQKVQVK